MAGTHLTAGQRRRYPALIVVLPRHIAVK